jgi:hypothetical protein
MHMKKIFVSLGVMSFALFFVFVACEPKKKGLTASIASAVKATPEKVATTIETGKESVPVSAPIPSLLPVSQLAFKSYMLNPKANIGEAKSLFLVAQADIYSIAESTAPENESKPINWKTFKAIDLCPCPDSKGLCPCPADSLSRMAATISSDVKVSIDKQELKPTPLQGKIGGNNWEVFEWPAKMPDGPCTLTISGKFFGKESKTYTLPMQVSKSQLYMKWSPK